jgi:hypothetical protein
MPKGEVASSGIIFVSSLLKIHLLVQMLLEGQAHRYNNTICPSFLIN